MSKYFPNAVGRPKSSQWVKHLAAKYTEEAIESIVKIARDEEVPANVRLAAWSAVMDRAHGKPAQELNANVNVNESSADDVHSRITALVASAIGGTDAEPTGEPH
jgi:uncharacterized protein (UPF0147 family)